MVRIGIFGGSFDMVHKGHEQVVRQALTVCDRVEVVPCFISRYDKNMSGYYHRKNMCHLAFQSFGQLVTVSNVECGHNINGKTYSLMNKYKEWRPKDELYCIVGADTLPLIKPAWYKGKELLSEFKFIIVKRPAHKYDSITMRGNYLLNNTNPCNISSSNIREYISNGEHKNVKKVLNRNVLDYIVRENLYKKEN